MLTRTISYYLNGTNIQLNVSNKNGELTVMQACHIANVEIPRFCYYDGLSISGNCRMCLVEIKNVQKPVASCAIPLVENMEIFTNSLYIYKIRESILEYILCNHPLDCPICDQAGECDLQDQAFVFGGDRSRYYEDKKVVIDKECGPFLTTVMTRCIHCTRCVRFYNEIVGVDVLGVLGRGNNMEISFYVKNLTSSELSGNLADICPVGAILTKSYIFQKRSWELFFLSTFDVLDTFGSLIRIDILGTKIFRILPRYNLYLNEEWITDRVRFFFDGYLNNRIMFPFIKETFHDDIKNQNIFITVSWHFVLSFIQKLFYIFSKKKNFLFLINVGNILDLETLISIKEFFTSVGFNFIINFQSHLKSRNSNDFSFPFFVGSYDNLFKSRILLLFGFNVRLEIPLLNIKFRKIFNKNFSKFIVFSNIASLNFFFKSIGFSYKTFYSFFEGRLLLCKYINNFKINYGEKTLMIGFSLYEQISSNFLYFIEKKIKNYIYKIKFYILNSKTCLLNATEIAFYKHKINNTKFSKNNSINYNIMCEDSKTLDDFSNLLKIRQNSHIIINKFPVKTSFVINLTTNTFLETSGSFFNLEGRLLKTRKFLMTKKVNVFKNFFIFNLIMKKLGYVFFKNILSIRKRLISINSNFLAYFYLNFSVIHELSNFYKNSYIEGILITKNNLKNKTSIIYEKYYFLKKQNPYVVDISTKSSKTLNYAFNRFFETKKSFFFINQKVI